MALALGRTVGELTATLTERELAEWMAFHRLSPIGELRHDLQAGAVAAMVGNAMGGGKKNKKPFKPSDFMFDVGQGAEDANERADGLSGGRALYEKKKRGERERRSASRTGDRT